MYIENIKLQNYRNYESLNGENGLNLGKQTTVLIGKNGMGKTNMITALKQSLSFIFTKSVRVSQSSFIANTIQKIKSFETTDAIRKFNPDGIQSSEGTFPIQIETKINIGEEISLDVIFRRENLSAGMKELFTSQAISFWNHYSDLQDLPVLAFYSDSFPHEKVTIGKKIQDLLNSKFGISQSAGYYNWDDPRDCGLVWQQYFTMQWKNDKYGHTKNNEAAYLLEVSDCMKKFAEPLQDSAKNDDFELKEITVMSRGKDDVVVLKFANGAEADFEALPAGYRRAFSVAFDLANRAFLLNKNCNPNGICFIDEIDLHLHPSLAQEMLDRLRHTFPRIQFIVSTHSPIVLSNFKQDKDNFVYQLGRGRNNTTEYKKLPNSYGIDYNSLLENQMESPVRNSMLRELITAYHYWKAAEDVERMNKILNLIIDKVGDESELVKNLQK
jgi:predicted ATP-binding protein involved in virulence